MASVTPAAGEGGLAPLLPGGPTQTAIVSRNPMPPRPVAPAIERVGSVRILRGAAAWRGVALRMAHPAGDDERFELALTAGDGRSVVVASAGADDAVALWRDFGRTSGLTLLLETAEGVVSEPYPQLGRLALGAVRIRRRHGLLRGRRPRFLTRRKTGRLAELPVIVGGDRMTD
ncbi:DUF6101 family protein [Bosea sp. (in: a-proteobacteria)]|uniref:DUF6101 family protein n=1 Tax=Bosea sp. (in: a-proteobacteria) TaxID=1871050 RepID=UPI00262E1B8C|nr:DUF6101 family protein [Bosea sp. (in: a-proteobacteria)]MCO5092317.1 DUF6101 family protein [Bosea sp. (in: a-proteobacteria)]